MKKESLSETIRCPCPEVFALLHNYERRLEWDTLLREARLLHGATEAGPGVQSLCAGKWTQGGIPMITEYVTFKPGEYAAVKMVNHPPFFASFAATIRHDPVPPDSSEITYTYHFEAKPRWLAGLLEPIMNRRLRRETAKRLRSLKAYLEKIDRPSAALTVA